MKVFLVPLAVVLELAQWYSTSIIHDDLDRLVAQAVLFSGVAVILFAIFSPVLAESDRATGDTASPSKMKMFSERALMVFVIAFFAQFALTYVLHMFIDVFITGDYFAR